MTAIYPEPTAALGSGYAGDPHSRMHGRTLHSTGENVMAHGAIGDNVHDDYDAIMSAIQKAYVTGGSVFFPTPPGVAYYTSTMFDITDLNGMHYLGGQGSPTQGTQSQFGYPPMVNIRGAAGLDAIFRFDGSSFGAAGRVTFENLHLFGSQTCWHINDCAQFHWENCSGNALAGGSANNACVVCENTFWTSFHRFDFRASAVGKPAVIFRGIPGPNVLQPSQVRFKQGVFNVGAIRYDQSVTPPGSITHNWHLEDITPENLPGGAGIIEVMSTAFPGGFGVAGGAFVFSEIIMENIDIADTQTPGDTYLIKNLLPDAFLRGITILNCEGGGFAALRDEGPGYFHGTFISSNRMLSEVTDASDDITGSYTTVTDAGLVINTQLSFGALYMRDTAVGQEFMTKLNANSAGGAEGGLQFGSGTSSTLDTNLYRSAANTLKTDDSLVVTGDLTLSASDIITDVSTGTKIGTSNTQKLGFFNQTPTTQPGANPDTSGAILAALETEVNEIKAVLRQLGLIAT